MFSLSLHCVAAFALAPSVFAAPGTGSNLAPVGSVGGPSRALSEEEATAWLAGRELFERSWTEQQGLGAPSFNAQSCAACHKDPVVGGASGNQLNVIGIHRQPGYGKPRMELVCGNGPRPESIDQQARLKEFRAHVAENGRGQVLFIETQAPTILGLGLLEAIPVEEILSREDPGDLDHDGIRGIARRIKVGTTEEIGRFGWKARTPHLTDFVCMALAGEVGLTAPDQGRGFGLAEDADSTQDPELSQEHFDTLAFFVGHLAAPRHDDDAMTYQAQLGEKLFEQAACSKCHVPVLNGADGPVQLYSDLLLHEVLPSPARGKRIEIIRSSRRVELEPPGFRTPPLWGVRETAPYLHDGRAATLLDAIRAHEGEASASRERFEGLEEIDQQALIAFVESL